MHYRRTITTSASAEMNQKYAVNINLVKVGEAEFLGKNGDEFEFDIQLNNKRESEYDYHVDLDRDTYELISLRASNK